MFWFAVFFFSVYLLCYHASLAHWQQFLILLINQIYKVFPVLFSSVCFCRTWCGGSGSSLSSRTHRLRPTFVPIRKSEIHYLISLIPDIRVWWHSPEGKIWPWNKITHTPQNRRSHIVRSSSCFLKKSKSKYDWFQNLCTGTFLTQWQDKNLSSSAASVSNALTMKQRDIHSQMQTHKRSGWMCWHDERRNYDFDYRYPVNSFSHLLMYSGFRLVKVFPEVARRGLKHWRMLI